MPITNDREYRAMRMAPVELPDDGDKGEMVVEGYASTFDEPYTLINDEQLELREQVDPAAFDGCDMEDVIMQYDHAGRVFARKRNGTLEVTTDEHGLKIRARLGGTEIGRQLYEEISGGYTDRMSFGFSVPKGGDRVEKTKGEDGRIHALRTITRIRKLYDVSAVSLPANDATEISARSLSEGVIEQATEEFRAEEERQRRHQAILAILGEV